MAQQKIRDDLEGVTFVHVDGQGVLLRAGDKIPAGALVGGHLTASGKPTTVAADSEGGTDDANRATNPDGDTPQTPTEPTEPKGNGSRDDWAAWAKHLGVEHAEDASRDDIKTAVAEHQAAVGGQQ